MIDHMIKDLHTGHAMSGKTSGVKSSSTRGRHINQHYTLLGRKKDVGWLGSIVFNKTGTFCHNIILVSILCYTLLHFFFVLFWGSSSVSTSSDVQLLTNVTELLWCLFRLHEWFNHISACNVQLFTKLLLIIIYSIWLCIS